MRRIFVLLAISALPGIALLQTHSTAGDTVFNRTDEKGLKQGPWKKYYPNGNLNYTATFKDDKPVDTLKRYFESGNLKALIYFNSAGISARARLFYEDGQVAAEGYYYNSLKDSLWKYYSYFEGTVISDEIYRKGKKHGLSHKYYPNGVVTEIIEWKDNIKDGIWEQYYQDKSLRLKGSYLNDELSGDITVYYPDGNIQMRGYYLNGKRHGKWSFFNEKDSLNYEVNFINGKAEDEEILTRKQQEYFQKIDENIGKFKEPGPEDFYQSAEE
jgi:antitoxin component YwqK of YwqJK toxin-antitoxin module